MNSQLGKSLGDTLQKSSQSTTFPCIGNQHFVPYSEVPLTQELLVRIFSVGVALCNQVIEHNVAAFSELSFAVR